MKCENDNCKNEVLDSDIERGCAGVIDHDDCTRYCSCCGDCRAECLNDSIDENENI